MVVLFLQVRGTCELDTRAQQVQEEAGSLNSDDVFVLETPAKTYLWIGKVRFSGDKGNGPQMNNLMLQQSVVTCYKISASFI